MSIVVKIFITILLSVFMLHANDKPKASKIRILITTGGHDYEEDAFFEMFARIPDITFKHIVLPDSFNLLTSGLENEFDVIVMYDMVSKTISEQQKMNFIRLLQSGIGIVSLHLNLGAHREWDEFKNIIGGKYLFKSEIYDGKKYNSSSYTHDVDFKVKIEDTNHPITKDMQDFKIYDETYKDIYVSPKVRVLLTTESPLSSPEIAWVTQYEKSPVFYLQLGHDSKAWENPGFEQILSSGIKWVYQESKQN
jgi:type 1 glutamine amidotransferase